MNELYKKYSKKGLQLVGVNLNDTIPDVKKFAKDHSVKYPLIGNRKDTAPVMKAYSVTGAPTSFVIDKNGKVVASFVGDDEAGVKAALKKLGIT